MPPAMTDTAQTGPPVLFDPTQADSFVPHLNLTDSDVARLFDTVDGELRHGEHDQGDVVAIEWDTLNDLRMIAAMYWGHHRGVRP